MNAITSPVGFGSASAQGSVVLFRGDLKRQSRSRDRSRIRFLKGGNVEDLKNTVM